MQTTKVLVLAQLRTPPQIIRRVELSVARSIIGGPGLWAPVNLFYHLREALGFPISLMAVDAICMSVMTKTSLVFSSEWQRDVDVLMAAAE
eukprot:1900566-Pyramimonas_sp.AAC.1